MLREGLVFLSESSAARRLVTGVPISRAIARRFVAGETLDELAAAVREANEAGFHVTCNHLGESVESREQALGATDDYLELLDRISEEGLDAWISVKLTQLGQDIDQGFVAANARRVVGRAADLGIEVTFDMESSPHVQRTLDLFHELRSAGFENMGVVLQSYLFRSEEDAREAVAEGARVRICKGAYVEPPEVAFQEKREVDRSFVRITEVLLDGGRRPGIATHDERMIQATMEHARRRGIDRDDFEFQLLYGVRRDLQRELVEEGYHVRLYIPYGEAWYQYLMRRLAERPANLLFLVGSMVQESPLGSLFDGSRRGGAGKGTSGGEASGGNPG